MKVKSKGMTLVELMVTLAVGGILLAIAVPSYRTMVQNNRLAAGANEFVSSMSLARSEALKRRTDITVTAADSSTAGNEWGKGGWTVKEGATLLKTVPAFSGDITFNSTGNNSSFTYSADGSANASDTIDLCTGSGETGRQVSLSATGRVSVNSGYTCP
ncbi:MAG: GspH/FimT family pseudopilin [Candidatus Sedimenticola sp. (ex Thyasira tokunagai)]